MRLAPWHVKGIDPKARETAREAARRSGVSVGQWLNTIIHGQAAGHGAAPAAPRPAAPRPAAPRHDEPPERHENIASITQRLDSLTRQLDRMARQPAAAPTHDDTPRRIADAILQLNGRLDQVLAEGRHASSALEQRVNSVDRALASLNQTKLRASAGLAAGAEATGVEGTGVDAVVAEIAARQRALDGDLAMPARGPLPPPMRPRSPAPPPPPPQPLASPAPLAAPPPPRLADYVPMHCRADDAVAGLRKDLAEIGRTLADAMPRRTDDVVAGLRNDLAEIGRTLT